MNIIVCYKLTPDPGDLNFSSDGSLALENAEWRIGEFDLAAIEAAMRLAEDHAGKVTALSVGPQQITNSKLKKDLLSRGPDELYLVSDPSLAQADTAVTAQVIKEAVHKFGEFDLILTGEGSADLYFQQVGIQLGERLGIPVLNAVSKIEVEDGSGKVIVHRNLEEEVEVVEVPLPAVLAVTIDIFEPRLPTMKDILKASKKPVTEWTLADLNISGPVEPHIEVIRSVAPPKVSRKRVKIEGDTAASVQALMNYLSKEGLV